MVTLDQPQFQHIPVKALPYARGLQDARSVVRLLIGGLSSCDPESFATSTGSRKDYGKALDFRNSFCFRALFHMHEHHIARNGCAKACDAITPLAHSFTTGLMFNL